MLKKWERCEGTCGVAVGIRHFPTAGWRRVVVDGAAHFSVDVVMCEECFANQLPVLAELSERLDKTASVIPDVGGK